jgi:Na+/H+ antiporter NhaD/arsenite permease-like protein
VTTAIVLIGLEALTPEQAARSVHLPTLILAVCDAGRLASTFAGNLFIVGSIANIIVVDAAARCGVPIDWKAHARIGVPVTLTTLAIVAVYLALRL